MCDGLSVVEVELAAKQLHPQQREDHHEEEEEEEQRDDGPNWIDQWRDEITKRSPMTGHFEDAQESDEIKGEWILTWYKNGSKNGYGLVV